MLWFPLVFLALQNRLGHGLGRTQLRGFRDRYPQFARSNVLQTWTMCQAVCFIKGGLGSSSSRAGIHLSVVHQNLQCPQMEGWGSVCSSAWSRLEVSIEHDLILEWAVTRLQHCQQARGPCAASDLWYSRTSGTRAGISILYYIKALNLSEMAQQALKQEGPGDTDPKRSINLSLQKRESYSNHQGRNSQFRRFCLSVSGLGGKGG